MLIHLYRTGQTDLSCYYGKCLCYIKNPIDRSADNQANVKEGYYQDNQYCHNSRISTHPSEEGSSRDKDRPQ